MREGPAKNNNHHQEQGNRSGCAAERSTPAAHAANSQNDRQGFHALDKRRKETCKKGRTGMGPVDLHKGRLAESEGRQPRSSCGDSPADTVPVALPWFRDSSLHAACSPGQASAGCGDGWWTVVGGRTGAFIFEPAIKPVLATQTMCRETESPGIVIPPPRIKRVAFYCQLLYK